MHLSRLPCVDVRNAYSDIQAPAAPPRTSCWCTVWQGSLVQACMHTHTVRKAHLWKAIQCAGVVSLKPGMQVPPIFHSLLRKRLDDDTGNLEYGTTRRAVSWRQHQSLRSDVGPWSRHDDSNTSQKEGILAYTANPQTARRSGHSGESYSHYKIQFYFWPSQHPLTKVAQADNALCEEVVPFVWNLLPINLMGDPDCVTQNQRIGRDLGTSSPTPC